jgi:adenylosuccinate lyase
MNELTTEQTLWAITPLDGRYRSKLKGLETLVSEGALICFRTLVEVKWLLHLADHKGLKSVINLDDKTRTVLLEMAKTLDSGSDESIAKRVKEIEATTNHDVKAVEYLLRERLSEAGASDMVLAFLHFACTSEDINNLSYALMLKRVRDSRLLPQMDRILDDLKTKSADNAGLAMLSRTHGQTASPTTLGKEFSVFGYRLQRQRDQLAALEIEAKINGAVGNFNAHLSAFPNTNWESLSKDFIENKLDLKMNPYTTQIENHDTLVEYGHILKRFNTILIDLSRDIWGYVSLGYFKQELKAGEVGSSTMPHKVNPIDFENAEGNLGLANSIATHFSDKLMISRWQRDLSDSTVLRALGTLIGHSELAWNSLSRGMGKIVVNPSRLAEDLDNAYEVLAEPVQTVMRRYGVVDAYERLKAATRGKAVTKESVQTMVNECSEIPAEAKKALLEMTPATYTGIAKDLATRFASKQ